MEKEVKGLQDNNTFNIEERSSVPPHMKVIQAIWSFRRKRLPGDWSIQKWKSRLCPPWWTASQRSQLLGYIRTSSDMEHSATHHDSEPTLGFTYKKSRLRTSIHTSRPRCQNIHEHPTWFPRGEWKIKIQHGLTYIS
jgi:hypothetical protein